jgi:biotin carboxyl carrier protein
MSQRSSHHRSLSIPDLPNRKNFRLYLVILLFSTAGILFIPFSLALSFTGKLASDGPTNEVKAPSDSIVSIIAPENQLLKSGNALFKFHQPSIKADINIIKEQLKTTEEQIKISLKECDKLTVILDETFEHAKQTFALKNNAFKLDAISRLNLLSARSELNHLNREIAQHEQSCLREQKKLMGEKNILEKELDKQLSINRFTETVMAPTDGYLHRINVKIGQHVAAGELLASYTSQGTAGATLMIPLRDRPFVQVGDTFLITSDAYQLLRNPPIRACKIRSISPDSFVSDDDKEMGKAALSYQAQCQFDKSPLSGDYPFLVGMSLNGSATSIKASLVQILLEGYRRLLTTRQQTR